MKSERVSIVTPVGNEAGTLYEFTGQMDSIISSTFLALYDVVCYVITDTGTKDYSEYVLSALGEKYPWLSHRHIRGAGLAAAYIYGYKLSLELGYDYIVELDVGHPIGILPQIIGGLADYDAVFCTRFHMKGGYQGPWQRRWISKLSTLSFNRWLGTSLSDATSGLQGFRKSALADIDFDRFISKGHDFQSELKYVVGMKTDRILELPFLYAASASSFRPKELIAAAKTLLNLKGVHGRK
jgi:dolichol-phosphate mannosyltransferase